MNPSRLMGFLIRLQQRRFHQSNIGPVGEFREVVRRPHVGRMEQVPGTVPTQPNRPAGNLVNRGCNRDSSVTDRQGIRRVIPPCCEYQPVEIFSPFPSKQAALTR